MVAGLSRWRRMNPSDRIKLSVAFSKPSAHHAAPTHTYTHTHLICNVKSLAHKTQKQKTEVRTQGNTHLSNYTLIDTIQHQNTTKVTIKQINISHFLLCTCPFMS